MSTTEWPTFAKVSLEFSNSMPGMRGPVASRDFEPERINWENFRQEFNLASDPPPVFERQESPSKQIAMDKERWLSEVKRRVFETSAHGGGCAGTIKILPMQGGVMNAMKNRVSYRVIWIDGSEAFQEAQTWWWWA